MSDILYHTDNVILTHLAPHIFTVRISFLCFVDCKFKVIPREDDILMDIVKYHNRLLSAYIYIYIYIYIVLCTMCHNNYNIVEICNK